MATQVVIQVAIQTDMAHLTATKTVDMVQVHMEVEAASAAETECQTSVLV